METMKTALIKQNEDDGKAMMMMGKIMMFVPTALMKEAQVATQSELDPDTAENAINVYKGGNIDFATSRFLDADQGGSDTAWYAVVMGKHRLNHELRQDLRLEQAVNIKNKVATFTIDGRWAESVTDWRRTWASKGDNSAYSS